MNKTTIYVYFWRFGSSSKADFKIQKFTVDKIEKAYYVLGRKLVNESKIDKLYNTIEDYYIMYSLSPDKMDHYKNLLIENYKKRILKLEFERDAIRETMEK